VSRNEVVGEDGRVMQSTLSGNFPAEVPHFRSN
jgi:hypothetical protein